MKSSSMLVICVLLAATGLMAQNNVAWQYTATYKYTLSTSAAVFTVQLPAAATKKVRFDGAYVYCSVQCEATLERDGTAATATELTPAKIDAVMPAAGAKAYRSSDAGAGTTLGGPYIIGAGSSVTLDLKDKRLRSGGDNLTIRTDAVTGTAVITIKWEEY
jgi:hypothetical protein